MLGQPAASPTTGGFGDLPGVAQVIRLAEQVMSVHSTRHALTMNKKIALVPWCWIFLRGEPRWKNTMCEMLNVNMLKDVETFWFITVSLTIFV